MVFRNYREAQNSIISITVRVWLLLLVYHLPEGICWGKQNELVESSEDYAKSLNYAGYKNPSSGSSCWYEKFSKTLICTGTLDYDYLETIRGKDITCFIVERYGAEPLIEEQGDWSAKDIETGALFLSRPKTYRKLAAVLTVEDMRLKINVISKMLKRRESNSFLVTGEVFSNKIIKISWGLKGYIYVNFIENQTVVSLDVGDIGGSDWGFRGNLTYVGREALDVDKWNTSGIIKYDKLTNKTAFYKGSVWTENVEHDFKFFGKVMLQETNLDASFSGFVIQPQKRLKKLTKSVFSNMKVQTIIFRDSEFDNDFGKNSFEGIQGLKRIVFYESRLERLRRLDDLIGSSTDLEEILIEYCITSDLKFGTSAKLKNVRKLSFKGSGPLNLNNESFLWLRNSNLSSISLGNSIVKLSPKADSIFWSVSHSLRKLDISHSTINSEKDLHSVLNKLNITILMADDLKLREVPKTALTNVRKTLKYLSLRKNDFRKSLEKNIFSNVLKFPLMPNLIELNLENCHINFIEKGTFDNLPNLKVLHLSFNYLENIQDGWQLITPKITSLYLQYNKCNPVTGIYEIETPLYLEKFKNLKDLDLSNGCIFSFVKTIRSLRNSIRNLNLENTKINFLPENLFENLTNLETLDLSNNPDLQLGQPFTFNFFKKLKKLKWLSLAECKNNLISVYDSSEKQNPDDFILENLKFLDLSVNNIKIIDRNIFKAFPKLKLLNLSRNIITGWTAMMNFNDNLETLILSYNKIETVTSEMLSDIKKLKNVELGSNPFVCGNYVYEIIKIVNLTSEKMDMNGNYDTETGLIKDVFYKEDKNERIRNSLQMSDWSEENYVCYSLSESKLIPFKKVNESFIDGSRKHPKELGLRWLVIVVVAGVAISVGIICWKFLDIHLLTRAVRNAVAMTFMSRNDKGPTNFKYNVFLSYSEKDRSWVIENLLPRLESKNDLKVCLHERDFQVGLSIIDNILNSIESSRNIILVISKAFLKSQWCQYEMQLAQFRLLEKGRDQLILIFLENIPAIKRPKTLKYLMMTKTYIKWPVNSKSGKDVDNFWNKLMKSLVNVN